METRTRDEDGERENADRLSGLEGITHLLDDLKFPDDYTIALIHDVRHLNARTLNDGMIAWSHGLLGGQALPKWRPNI